jgi:perosamine synthetase
MIPYGRHSIDEDDIRAVVDALQSDWLTTGPRVAEFESKLSAYVGAKETVAVNNGTAALHLAMYALDIVPGDEVIVPAITFAATANCVIYQGGTPVFCDVEPDTLLIDPARLEERITERTKAIVAVDYAGQPCDYDALQGVADKYGLTVVADACHSLGGAYKGKAVGGVATLSTFSFHPVKNITTGEGGAVTTNCPEFAQRMRMFRNHGISADHHQRSQRNTWKYDVQDLGHNYRITDLQCALGLSQLRKLNGWIKRRREIATFYSESFSDVRCIDPLATHRYANHAHHLYVVRVERSSKTSRDDLFLKLRSKGIGTNVHYKPVYLHPYYRSTYNFNEGLCPVAEDAFGRILSLPMYHGMSDEDMRHVSDSVRSLLDG